MHLMPDVFKKIPTHIMAQYISQEMKQAALPTYKGNQEWLEKVLQIKGY